PLRTSPYLETNTSEAGRPSRTRAFEDPLGPTIMDRVDQAAPESNRALARPGGGLVAFDDLLRVAELVRGRREHFVREPHLLRLDDLLPRIAKALRLEGLGPEARLVREVEEHFVDRVEPVRRRRDHDERLHGDVAPVRLDVASDGGGQVARAVRHRDDALAPDDILDPQEAPRRLDEGDESLAGPLRRRREVRLGLRHDEGIDAGLRPEGGEIPIPIVRAERVDPDGDLPTPPVGLPDRGRESLAGRGLLLLRYTILQIEHDRVRVERRGLRDHSRVV